MQTSKFGSFSEVRNSKDPEGLTVFYYLLQDLKCLILSIISLHFRVSKAFVNRVCRLNQCKLEDLLINS